MLDKKVDKINRYFNYRHQRFALPLKSLSRTSDTREWGSHRLNWKITLQNFSRYEELEASDEKFPELRSKIGLIQDDEYQSEYCSFYDQLELKNANLLNHLKVYIRVMQTCAEKQ